MEVGEKRDRIVDALNATRAAVEQGIVPGGGTALLWASRQLGDVKASCTNMDMKIGVEIIERACRAPVRAISNNAGVEGSVVVGELLKNTSHEMGYDAQKGVYCNMIQNGIMDPTKVGHTIFFSCSVCIFWRVLLHQFYFRNLLYFIFHSR